MHARHIHSRQSAGAAARALWLLRWLLVLVIIWDQVGSPLHHHQHDSGVDAQWLSATAHGSTAAAPHLEDHHDDLRISHAVLAVRPQLDLSSLAVGDEPNDSVAPSHAFVRAWLDPPSELAPGAGPPTPHSTYRSLPPAGRAPPLHT